MHACPCGFLGDVVVGDVQQFAGLFVLSRLAALYYIYWVSANPTTYCMCFIWPIFSSFSKMNPNEQRHGGRSLSRRQLEGSPWASVNGFLCADCLPKRPPPSISSFTESVALFGTTYPQLIISRKSELIPPNSLRPSRDEKPRAT
jgi:hypothetical protein